MKILTYEAAERKVNQLIKKGIPAKMRPRANGYIVVEQLPDEQDPMFI